MMTKRDDARRSLKIIERALERIDARINALLAVRARLATKLPGGTKYSFMLKTTMDSSYNPPNAGMNPRKEDYDSDCRAET
jgi:hypothetical protein